MNLTRRISVTVILLAVAGVPAWAAETAPTDEARQERAVHAISLGDPDQAERLFDALNLILECRGDRPQVDLTLAGDAVLISGKPQLVRHLTALLGADENQRQRRQGRQRRVQKDSGAALAEMIEDFAALEEELGRPDGREKSERRGRRGVGRTREGQERRDGGAAREERSERRRGQRRGERTDRGSELEVRVFEPTFAEAREMIQFVDMLRVGSPAPWAAACDPRTNSIIVKGPPRLVDEAAELIEQLDRPGREREVVQVMKLMPLSHGEAVLMADVINRIGRNSFDDVTVVPDIATNTIVLAGPEHQVLGAASLIAELDAKPKPSKREKASKAKKDKMKDKSAKQKQEKKKVKKQKKEGKDTQKPAAKGDDKKTKTKKKQQKKGPAKPGAETPDSVDAKTQHSEPVDV